MRVPNLSDLPLPPLSLPLTYLNAALCRSSHCRRLAALGPTQMRPPAPASVTTSLQLQYRCTRMCTRSPSTLTPPPRHGRDTPQPYQPNHDLNPATPPPPRHGPPATSTHQRRAPQPALAPSRHSPYHYLDAGIIATHQRRLWRW
ncbi:hypothetical protein EDB85DRAFT_2158977 [Lactarius pseudohatsudake]|nr:hypothetical protein EDB85DRAFT_2158977 [Lactarius pseudohatsudake]